MHFSHHAATLFPPKIHWMVFPIVIYFSASNSAALARAFSSVFQAPNTIFDVVSYFLITFQTAKLPLISFIANCFDCQRTQRRIEKDAFSLALFVRKRFSSAPAVNSPYLYMVAAALKEYPIACSHSLLANALPDSANKFQPSAALGAELFTNQR